MEVGQISSFKKLVDEVISARPVAPISLADVIKRNKLEIEFAEGPQGVARALFSQIPIILEGKGNWGHKEFSSLREHLVMEYFFEDIPYLPYMPIAEKISDATRLKYGRLSGFENNREEWRAAITLALDHNEISHAQIQYVDSVIKQSNFRQFHVASQARILKSKGFNLSIKNARVHFDNVSEYEKVCNRIDELVKVIGGQRVIITLLTVAKGCWDQDLFRFHFVRKVSQINEFGEPSIPWGYLINLSAKYPFESADYPTAKQDFQELIELSIALAATFDVQPYNSFEGMFNSTESIVRYLQEILIYDTIFSIRQIRPQDAVKFCRSLFEWVDEQKLEKWVGWKISSVLSIFEVLAKQADPFHVMTVRTEQVSKFLPKLKLQIIEKILDDFSFDGNANNGYKDPNDVWKIDFQFKPLIKKSEVTQQNLV